jgi:hypothetical protein
VRISKRGKGIRKQESSGINASFGIPTIFKCMISIQHSPPERPYEWCESPQVSHISVAFFFVSLFSDSGTDAGGLFGKAHALIFQQS